MQALPINGKQNPFLKKVRQLLTCLLTGDIYNKPVYISCGHIFSRGPLETKLASKDACPKCNKRNVWSTLKDDFLLEQICNTVRNELDENTLLEAVTEQLQDIILFNFYLFPVINTCGHTFEKQQIPGFKNSCPTCRAPFDLEKLQPNYLIIALVGLLLSEKNELVKNQNADAYLGSHSPLDVFDKGFAAVIAVLAQYPFAINRSFTVLGEQTKISIQQFVIKAQNVDFLKALLAMPLFNNGSEHHLCDHTRSSLLTLAAAERGSVAFDYILNLPGANVNYKNARGESALFIAASNGDLYKVQQLLAMPKVDVVAADKLACTAQQIAREHGHHAIADLLDPSIVQLRELVQKSDFVSIIKMLIAAEDQQKLEKILSALLSYLPREENLAIACISKLFNEIVNTKEIDQNRLYNIVFGFLNVDINLMNKPFLCAGATPLHFAILRADQELLNRLLQVPTRNMNSATMCAKHGVVMTPLALAVAEGVPLNMVQILCNAGADPNTDDTNPIYFAIKRGNTEQVKILLPLIKGQRLYDAWQYSKAYGSPEITQLFEQPIVRLRMYLQCCNYQQAALELLTLYEKFPQLYEEFFQKMSQFLSVNITRAELLIQLGKKLLPIAWQRNHKILCIDYLNLEPRLVNEVITDDGKTVLHAVVADNEELLLDKLLAIDGVELDKPIANPGRFGHLATAVHIACYRGINTTILRKLLGRSATPHARNFADETPLLITTENGDADKVLLLLSLPDTQLLKRAYDIAHQRPRDPAFMAIFTDQNYKMRMYLQEKDYKKIAAILIEVYESDKESVEKMWQYLGQLMPLRDSTLLIYQAIAIELLSLVWQKNYRALLLDIIKKYPELLNKPLIDGKTLIHLTADTGNLELTKEFLKVEGVDVNTKVNKQDHPDYGCTPLHFACLMKAGASQLEEQNRKLIVDELLQRKANAELKNAKGETALYIAALSGNLSTCIRLLNIPGINTAVIVNGKSISAIARENDNRGIVLLLNHFEITRNLLSKDKFTLTDLQLPENINVQKITATFPGLLAACPVERVTRTKYIMEFCSQDAKAQGIKINFSVAFYHQHHRDINIKQLVSMFPASQDLRVLQASVFSSFENFLRTLHTKGQKLEYISWAKGHDFFCQNYDDPKQVPQASPTFFQRFTNLFGDNSAIKEKLEIMEKAIRMQPDVVTVPAPKSPAVKATAKKF